MLKPAALIAASAALATLTLPAAGFANDATSAGTPGQPAALTLKQPLHEEGSKVPVSEPILEGPNIERSLMLHQEPFNEGDWSPAINAALKSKSKHLGQDGTQAKTVAMNGSLKRKVFELHGTIVPMPILKSWINQP